MKTKVILRAGFVPTKLQSRKQLEKAEKEVEKYNKDIKKWFTSFYR